MRLPSKVCTYKESVLSRFPVFLNLLKKESMGIKELYRSTASQIEDVSEFVEILSCLFILDKISLDLEDGVITYVSRD